MSINPHFLNKKKNMIKILKLSLSNIWRNKVLSLATIFVMAIIIFIFNTILAINFISQDTLNSLGEKIDLIVYLKETSTTDDIKTLTDDIKTLEGVINVTYTSKESALTELTNSHPDLTLAFDKYNIENPLPQSINITTSHPSFHKNINEFLQQEKYSRVLSDINAQDNNIINSVSENLINLTGFAEQILFWLIITFLIGGSLIIINAIQITIFNRKKEIEVMKIVGATRNYIRLPFIIESIIYGLLAILISFGMLFVLSNNLSLQGTEIWSLFYNLNLYKIFFIELAATMLLTTVSSILAVHDHL